MGHEGGRQPMRDIITCGYSSHQHFSFCSWRALEHTSAMHLGATHWVVTANFTADGGVAYRRADGSWAPTLAEAQLIATEEEAEPFVRQAALREQHVVCDPYAIDVRWGSAGIEPLTARESIRARGPTVPLRRPDNGQERSLL
jgi:hypothetical protein